MAALPKRSRAHEIETESRNFVKSALPQSWIVEDVDLDYGTDIRVEIVEEGRPTGHIFLIQVRGHERADVRRGFVAEVLDVRHLNYYQKLVVPVFLVVYDCSTKSAVYVDIKSHIETVLSRESPGWKFQKSVKIRIPLDLDFQQGHPRIANSVREFFALHGLGKPDVPPNPFEELLGSVVLRLADVYSGRKDFSKVLKDVRKALGIRTGRGPPTTRIRERLESVAAFEEESGQLLVRLLEPTGKMLGRVSAWITNENLLMLLDSPWAKFLEDPYFCAFIAMIRARTDKALISRVDSYRFSNLDLYFALIEELMATEPDSLLRIKSVVAESVIQSAEGGRVFRSTRFRFTDPSLNESYEEFRRRSESREWSEVVVTDKYYALVMLSSPTPEGLGPVTAKTIETRHQKTTISISFFEYKSRKGAVLVRVPVVRKIVDRPQPLISMHSEAARLDFRLGSDLGIVGGQQVRVEPLTGAQGPGGRLFVDGIPVLEVKVGVDLSKTELPTGVRRAIKNMREDLPFPRTIINFAGSDLEKEELAMATTRVTEVIWQRYEALSAEP